MNAQSKYRKNKRNVHFVTDIYLGIKQDFPISGHAVQHGINFPGIQQPLDKELQDDNAFYDHSGHEMEINS
jgi:hypothetical protein